MITQSQFQFALRHREKAWLYVVENAHDPNLTRIHQIRDFAARVTRFGFDAGWRGAAEGSVQAPGTLPPPTIGQRVVLIDGRSGMVQRIFGSGQNQGVDIAINGDGSLVRVPWRSDRLKPTAQGSI